jgi:hypothetical protein
MFRADMAALFPIFALSASLGLQSHSLAACRSASRMISAACSVAVMG